LDAAESNTQLFGLNAFSYKDLQSQVGIKTSSIHYYFPSKHDLVVGMIERYIARYNGILDTIEKEHSLGIERLEALSKVFVKVLQQGKFCICGMLSSDLKSLPAEAVAELDVFFNLNQCWIAHAIKLAKQQGQVKETVDHDRAAGLLLGALEGGMLIARVKQSPDYLEAVVEQAIQQIKP
jgi:TetR/AcrR family transcriptional repressor of nem operon